MQAAIAIFGFVLLFFSSAIFAIQQPEAKQIVCPTAEALKLIRIMKSDLIEKVRAGWRCCDSFGRQYYVHGKWETKVFSQNFETAVKWNFSYANIDADNSVKALEIINQKHDSLAFVSGPHKTQFGIPYCKYNNTSFTQYIA